MVTDVIAREPKPNTLLEEALKNARPFNWDEIQSSPARLDF
jgi:hypothetical protein